MRATLTIQGFGFTPDEALTDLRQRIQRQEQTGWLDPTTATVAAGRNPYSVMPVHGHVATATLTKEGA